ncbi:hypothetical protein E2C01_101909 [Portunus trituberculatus]|uniref:Uncharacterized protein n=1 Tax=Portunus trituberculatus TaxID=210409 RepID=A0A5B7KLH5_PORTR|nr:hypothetical protein [Portunus trituberculatus]
MSYDCWKNKLKAWQLIINVGRKKQFVTVVPSLPEEASPKAMLGESRSVVIGFGSPVSKNPSVMEGYL